MAPRGFLCAIFPFAMAAIASGQSSSTPFDLSWTAGACRNCEIVRQVAEIGVFAPGAVLAEGYYFPAEGQGSGDYSVVRSSHSGMDLAERRLIQRALGPAVIAAMDRVDLRPEPGAWRALARAVILSAGDVATDPRGRAILAAICRRAVVADDRVPGRIGEHRLSEGCYSFNEAMTLAAAHLKQTGRAAWPSASCSRVGRSGNSSGSFTEIAAVVTALEDDQRTRVIRYIVDRFKINGAPVAPPPRPEPEEAVTEQKDQQSFEDFATLFDACSPNTDSLRALVGAYWVQVCQGNQGFDGQSVNKELKHLGHGLGNITMALNPLIGQKPAYVLQLRKSGNTKQARKLYKVTEAGIRKVKAMIAGEDTE